MQLLIHALDTCLWHQWLNTLGPGDIFKCIIMTKKFCISFRISQSLFPMVELRISKNSFKWHGTGKATSHYLIQCWPRYIRHITSLAHNELSKPLAQTQRPYCYQDKLAAICQWHFQIHFIQWNFSYFDSNATKKCILKSRIVKKMALVQIMAWHRKGADS